MALSDELISQFAKITSENQQTPTETTVYGTAVSYDGGIWVRIDGSDRLTPVDTTADMKPGDRVMVTIKNHAATVTGNVSSPSASKDVVDTIGGKVEEVSNQITEFEIVIADKVSTSELEAERARIDELVATDVTIRGELNAAKADIGQLEADSVTVNQRLTAFEAEIEDLSVKKLDVTRAEAEYATIKNLEATNAEIRNLDADFGEFQDLTTNHFTANDASIKDLQTNKLSADTADIRYAQIDFANIGEAAIEKLFSDSGIIKDLVVSEGHITGELVGVTIKGDIIEGGTVVADKLVVKGSDGLFYKLNTDGATTSAEQTEYNSLNGSVITAKSVTAEKVNVDDLVAFDATIGGFNITSSAIYSGVKSSVSNTTRGVYLDKTGQVAFGDSSNYLKYYKDTDNTWKLAISASAIKIGASSKDLSEVIQDVENKVDGIDVGGRNYVLSTGLLPKTGNGLTIEVNEFDIHIYGTNTKTDVNWGMGNWINRAGLGLKPGESSITVSTTEPLPEGLYLGLNTANSAGTQISAGVYLYGDGVTKSKTFTLSDSGSDALYGFFGFKKETTTVDVTFRIKLELGNVATDWTPAPEETITDTAITYQAGASQTTAPTGTWSTSIPTVTTALPYLWIKKVYTYIGGATSTEYSVSSTFTLDDFEVGGVNLIKNSNFKNGTDGWVFQTDAEPESDDTFSTYQTITQTDTYGGNAVNRIYVDLTNFEHENGKTYSLSFYAKASEAAALKVYRQGTNQTITTVDLTTEWQRFEKTYTSMGVGSLTFSLAAAGTYSLTNVKLERGDKVTDWTPAPEDMATSVDLEYMNESLNDRIDETDTRVEAAEASLDILSDSISSLVVDENGESLMTQTSTGWSFNMGTIQSVLDSAVDDIENIQGDVTNATNLANKANSLLNDLTKKTAYINVGTDDSGAPCIELGKVGNDFKVRITNTAIDFMQGSQKIAYITNHSLYIQSSVVTDELQIGDETGFIWKKRGNGNMGLRWIG